MKRQQLHPDIKLLGKLSSLHTKLHKSNSSNDKIAILEAVVGGEMDLLRLLSYMYDPYKQYYSSWKNILKRDDLHRHFTGTIFNLLDMLSNRAVTGHDALGLINDYRSKMNNDAAIELIFERSLKARIDSKLINRVFPGLIPTFDVALATKYENYADRFNPEEERWMWSRKLDGVRVIMRIENGTIKYFSRQGKEFNTLDRITQSLKAHSIMKENIVLDGELCIVDENGNENFQSVIKEIRRKDHTIKKPRFKVFDCLTIEEFDSGVSSEHRAFAARYDDIQWKLGNPLWDANFPIDLVVHEFVLSKGEIPILLDNADDSGWEGIMLRKDVHYKGKRSNDILKVKKMHDAEYVVEDVEYGPFRMIDPKTGLETTIETMTNVIIKHKGNVVSVGSGFSLAQRARYFGYPERIVGKEITVQYFEESQDKTGKHSLRFPVCKAVWEDGRQV